MENRGLNLNYFLLTAAYLVLSAAKFERIWNIESIYFQEHLGYLFSNIGCIISTCMYLIV